MRSVENILVVDDEPSVAKLEKCMLERLGYHVTMRTNVREALNDFRDRPDDYDLVMTDLTMPEITGEQLARELSTIKPDIPIIICTGHDEKIETNQAKRNGVQAILKKPFVKSELADLIRNVLDKSD